jgi:uncharacterized membrane protein YjgN (DUF898 family)
MYAVSQTPPPGPPYGGPPPPNAYGQQPYGFAPQDHPKSVTVLVLGILGLVACSIAAPFAWVMGNNVVREIDASGGQLGGRSTANAGRICGIVGTVILGLSLLAIVAVIVVAVAGAASTA